MLDGQKIARLHDQATCQWHAPGTSQDHDLKALFPQQPPSALLETILANHGANFDLWHEEDKAREPGVSDASIAAVKHAIDSLNQRRNDLVEAMDRILLEAAGPQSASAPLHSETPGLIVDRLSILALKIFHTNEEAHRESATDAHRRRNRERLELLIQQRDDLAGCLSALWQDILHQRRRFKLYRQLKMYNDPELNPAIYKHRERTPS